MLLATTPVLYIAYIVSVVSTWEIVDCRIKGVDGMMLFLRQDQIQRQQILCILCITDWKKKKTILHTE